MFFIVVVVVVLKNPKIGLQWNAQAISFPQTLSQRNCSASWLHQRCSLAKITKHSSYLILLACNIWFQSYIPIMLFFIHRTLSYLIVPFYQTKLAKMNGLFHISRQCVLSQIITCMGRQVSIRIIPYHRCSVSLKSIDTYSRELSVVSIHFDTAHVTNWNKKWGEYSALFSRTFYCHVDLRKYYLVQKIRIASIWKTSIDPSCPPFRPFETSEPYTDLFRSSNKLYTILVQNGQILNENSSETVPLWEAHAGLVY